MKEIAINELIGLTPTKTNISIVTQQLVQPILDGNENATEFAVKCQFVIDTVTESMKIAKGIALKNNVPISCLGAKIEVTETGIEYDYASNLLWQSINENLEKLLKDKKEIEEKIKMATKINSTIMDGDEIVASPVVKKSTTTLKITLGK